MSEHETLAAIFARLTRLERNYRRMRLTAILFASLAVIAVLTGQSGGGPTVIGDPRGARTSISPNGVLVYDANGTIRLDMTVDGTTPGFGVHGPDGKLVFEANSTNVGGVVHVRDNANAERAFLGMYTNGTTGMQIYNASAKVVAEINGTATGGFVRTGDGSSGRAYIGLFNDGRSGMQITNSSGKIVVAANEGSPGGFVELSDSSGTDRAYLGLFTDGAAGAWTRNASSTQTWRAP